MLKRNRRIPGRQSDQGPEWLNNEPKYPGAVYLEGEQTERCARASRLVPQELAAATVETGREAAEMDLCSNSIASCGGKDLGRCAYLGGKPDL